MVFEYLFSNLIWSGSVVRLVWVAGFAGEAVGFGA